jgi:hypothetical protein
MRTLPRRPQNFQRTFRALLRILQRIPQSHNNVIHNGNRILERRRRRMGVSYLLPYINPPPLSHRVKSFHLSPMELKE